MKTFFYNVFLLTIVCLGAMGFMLLTPNGIKWKDRLYDRFPEISFAVRPVGIGANMGFDQEILHQSKESAKIWDFSNTGIALSMLYKGVSMETPVSIDKNICQSADKASTKEKTNLVYFSSELSSGCTDVACAYIWSCAGSDEILHFDIEINDTEFPIETGSSVSKAF